MSILKNINRGLVIPMLFGVLLIAMPSFALAGSPPSGTLIPCGYDLNDDGKVWDPPMVASGADLGWTWTPGNHEQCHFQDVILIAQNVINFLIFRIAMPLAAIMFAYAGFLYVTNRGNESQVKQAHDIFLNVFIGLVVALAAWIFVNFILTFFLGADSPFNLLG